MPLPRMYADVLLDAGTDETTAQFDPIEYRVEIRAADQLRGELEGKRIPRVESGDAMHTTYLWIWSAMVREGKYSGSFGDFLKVCIQGRIDKNAVETVPPTDQAASDDSA